MPEDKQNASQFNVLENPYSSGRSAPDSAVELLQEAAAQSILEEPGSLEEYVRDKLIEPHQTEESWLDLDRVSDLAVFASDELGLGRITHAVVFFRYEDGDGELVEQLVYGVGSGEEAPYETIEEYREEAVELV